MGTWKQEAQSVVWDVNQNIKGVTDGANSIFSGLVGGAKAAVGSILNGSSVVGINVNEIENMKASISSYINDLETHLNEVKTQADTTGAFKGEYAVAIRQYVEAVAEACKCITSNLLIFRDKLTDVKAAYEASDANLKSAIGGASSEVEGAFQRYQQRS